MAKSMMKVVIYNYDSKEKIVELDTPIVDSIWDLKPYISDAQSKSDILGLGCTAKIMNLGIKEFWTRGTIMSSLRKGDAMIKNLSPNSFVMGETSDTIKEPTCIEYYKYENDTLGERVVSNLRIGIETYVVGYVINSGKETHNIFGGTNTAYFRTITRRNFCCAAKGLGHKAAKIFTNYTDIEKCIEKNKDVFEFMVRKYGYQFSVEKLVDVSIELKGKALDKENVAITHVESLLDEINSLIFEEVEEVKVPTEANDDNMYEEALSRIKSSDLYSPVVAAFKKNRQIYMSEGGGIIYDLDEGGKDAIKEITSKGYLPWHVIKTGSLYAVLYVSTNTEEWSYERVSREGYVDSCYVYNASCPELSEYGSIKMASANGGLIRTA